MAVVEALSEEEAYLWAILTDESGIDQAEFTWVDEETDDSCFRVWPFQWKWWRCTDALQIDQAARSVGKSLSIKARAYAFPFVHPGSEMVITAPEGVHLDAITDVVETAFLSTRLGLEVLKGGRQSFRHKPFHCNFKNGARIMGRIPQRDGKGVKGTHPIWLELDEAQDYPDAGWTELNETLKRGHEGAVWRAHGVTRGVRDKFFKYTSDPNSNWTVHRVTAMHRPTWTDEERQEKIEQYGGRDDPDYRRNILGLHGDSVSPLFVLHRLYVCVDDDKGSDYNQDEYAYFKINEAYLRETGLDIVEALDFPSRHRTDHKRFWAGMDVGFTNHPSEILIFAEHKLRETEKKQRSRLGKAVAKDDSYELRLVTRINLTRVANPDQIRAVLWVVDHYKPVAFSMDKTGAGLPLFQDIQDKNQQAGTIIKGYGFSEKILVDFDQTIEVDEDISMDDLAKEAGIKRNTVEYSTDILRKLVDQQRLWLPWDEDLLGEFQGQTYRISKTAMNQYGKREYSMGKFHALDAARMAVLGWQQYGIEKMMQTQKEESVLPRFVY